MPFVSLDLMNTFLDDYAAGARDVRSEKLSSFKDPDRSAQDLDNRFTTVETESQKVVDLNFFITPSISDLAAPFDPTKTPAEFQRRVNRAGLNITFDDPFEEVENTVFNIQSREYRRLVQLAIDAGAIRNDEHLQEVVARAGGSLLSTRKLHAKDVLSPATGNEFDRSAAITLRRMKSYVSILTGLKQI